MPRDDKEAQAVTVDPKKWSPIAAEFHMRRCFFEMNTADSQMFFRYEDCTDILCKDNFA